MHKGTLSVVAVGAAALFGFAAQQKSAPPQMADNVTGYHLSASIPLPDEGFWDYLGIDEANHHLFVSHSDEILVISTDRNQVVGKLAPTPRSHGVVISQKDDHGFTSNSGNSSGQQGVSSFTEFDPKTLAIIKQIILPIERLRRHHLRSSLGSRVWPNPRQEGCRCRRCDRRRGRCR